jgi:glycosyltransferase involved in cell wall biosynthesis
MRKIIIFPGNSNNIFFQNELQFIKDSFDEIVVFSFNKTSEILQKKIGGKVYDIKNVFLYVFSITFIKWLFFKETKMEVSQIIKEKKSLKKLLYLIYYGLYYSSCEKKVSYEIKTTENTKIYLYSMWLSRGAYVIAKFAGRNEVKCTISRAHGYDLYEFRNKLQYLPYRSFLANNLTAISFISENGMDYFHTKYPSSVTKKFVSRLGTMQSNLFKVIKEKKVVTIVSCSSIIAVKRIDLIIDVLSEIKIPIEWYHIGSGKEQKQFIQYANTKLKKCKFSFLGSVSNSLILETLIKLDTDYFINLSDSEGIPVSIMEAISLGIPAIARNVGGVSEIVNNENGLLLNSEENKFVYSSLITNELLNRLSNTQKYITKSMNAFAHWRNLYDGRQNLSDFFNEVYNV